MISECLLRILGIEAVKIHKTVLRIAVVADGAFFEGGFDLLLYYCILNCVFGFAYVSAAAYKHNAGQHEAYRKGDYGPHGAVCLAGLLEKRLTEHCFPSPFLFVISA